MIGTFLHSHALLIVAKKLKNQLVRQQRWSKIGKLSQESIRVENKKS